MEYKNKIEYETFDEERSLYNLKDTIVENCTFAGINDGESVLKEARNISVRDCNFSLRYPMWHDQKFELINSTFNDLTRAPIWYSNNGLIKGCNLEGIKLLRECNNVTVDYTTIDSKEFGWKCNNITITNSNINSEYVLLDSNNVTLDNVEFSGKYSFQYINNLTITNSNLNTKDAFWHSKNVTVKNSIIKGEYLAWFSDGLTLIDCTIIGTQPFCYCKNLKLINCKMIDCDLAFEYSDVEADVRSHVDSIKNPKSGTITVDSVGEVIMDSTVMDCSGKVIIR